MEFSQVANLYKDLSADNYCFFYRGVFSDEITNYLFNISENKLNDTKEEKKVRKKVNFLMIECIQNIERHGIQNAIEEDESLGYFSLRSRRDCFYLTSSNVISNDKVKGLTKNLNQINELSKTELKELYKVVLGGGALSEKGGAGLGIIEMARKSGNKLKYAFEQVDDQWSYFYLQISLSAIKDREAEELDISDSIRYHKALLAEDASFLYYGNFSNETIKPIARTLEQNIAPAKNSGHAEIMFHVLVELMQNIAKYSMDMDNGKEGIFVICKTEDDYEITAGNYILKDQRQPLETLLNEVNSHSSEELDELYKKELLNDEDHSKSAGIGYIDIARTIKKPLTFEFKPNSNKDLYMVQVMV